MEGVIIPSAFAGTPFYFALINSDIKLLIDHYGFFYKQTFRNRANVLSPNGVVALVVPVIGGRKYGTPLKNIRIDYTENWIHTHLKALETYYSASPFFEVLYDDIRRIYAEKFEFLWQLNKVVTDYVVDLIDLEYNNTEFNFDEIKGNYLDLTKVYSPKRDYLSLFKIDFPPYYQLFSDRYGFVKELSIFDLIFNTGSEAGTYIRQLSKELSL